MIENQSFYPIIPKRRLIFCIPFSPESFREGYRQKIKILTGMIINRELYSFFQYLIV
jgi:hypothetical protein